MSDRHYCVGHALKPGRQVWGDVNEKPLTDPIPPETLEMHPDALLTWEHCGCGVAICGKSAPFVFRAVDGSGVDVYLCAEHYDEAMATKDKDGAIFRTWHDCSDMKQAFDHINARRYRLDKKR
jgi:hypothetical protein